MRAPALVVLLVAICLGALWSFATSAQIDDPNACERTCQERSTACIDACETHTNPVECEAACQDALSDCLRQCY